ncbi:STAS domain-containing protein [Litoreibacter roseus]|uniref:STAS domain-containing protein n=1 Tax=Litoreibacter roseus TaxID=2601869 RepID=A0A6N6JFA9_9RHOB|nr:STAS domain-containing protein [Litoreibacter roseus]GFE64814.1 hypothetical protein KIN_18880 [Litoreibacter roseus]
MSADVQSFKLPERPNRDVSEQLYKLAINLPQNATLDVNAKDVRRLGALNAQLLFVIAKEFQQTGQTLTLTEPSDQFQKSLRSMGFSENAFEESETE